MPVAGFLRTTGGVVSANISISSQVFTIDFTPTKFPATRWQWWSTMWLFTSVASAAATFFAR